ncbi:MAG: signal peptidase II [Bacillota bacterium]|nr:signal peptidase II [Bacillota bacterium]
MLAMWTFLKPTKLKMLFLVEWVVYVLIELSRAKLRTAHQLMVAAYPLIVFYLIGCALAAAALVRTPTRLPRWRHLLGLAVLLVALEQLVKAAISAFIPYRASVPIIPGWLHLAHARNMRGSWLAREFGIGFLGIGPLIAMSAIVLPCFVLGFRYYAVRKRRSLWVDVAFVTIVAGVGGALCDLALHGYILDFINLPGVMTADLKDIFIYVGLAALFAELVDDPAISMTWLGWRRELERTRRFIRNFAAFSAREVRKVARMLTGG